jgi:hypothetical protein
MSTAVISTSIPNKPPRLRSCPIGRHFSEIQSWDLKRDVTLIFAFLLTPNDRVARREIRGGFQHRLLCGILVPVTFRCSFARPAA